jgi:hypothetical protein
VVYSTADGAQETLLEREDFEYNFFGPQWSPDGRWLSVFLGYLDYGPGGFLGKPDAGLYLFDTSCLFEMGACSRGLYGPFRIPAQVWGGSSWSPDSHQLAMVSDRVDGFEIFDVQSRTFYSLPTIAGYDGVISVSWSPDGLWLAYAQRESELDSSRDIYVMPVKGGPSIHLVGGSSEEVVVGWITIPLPMHLGQEYTITQSGTDLHLRSLPALSGTILRTLQPGDQVVLLDGPVGTDGYRWWKMSVVADGIEGWAVEHPDWYRPVTP